MVTQMERNGGNPEVGSVVDRPRVAPLGKWKVAERKGTGNGDAGIAVWQGAVRRPGWKA